MPGQGPSGLCLELGSSRPDPWLKEVKSSDHEAAN